MAGTGFCQRVRNWRQLTVLHVQAAPWTVSFNLVARPACSLFCILRPRHLDPCRPPTVTLKPNKHANLVESETEVVAEIQGCHVGKVEVQGAVSPEPLKPMP